MISIDRETKITFSEDDVYTLMRLAKYVIEVVATRDVNGYGWDKETIDELNSFAHRFCDAVPLEGFL